MLSYLVIVACLPLLIAAKCGEWQDCASCASHKEGGLFNFECRWCETTKSCHDFSLDPDCPSSEIIDVAYDCPIPPRNGYTYTDDFARTKMLPIAAAAASENPQACLTNALGAQLRRQLTVHCDSSQKDTCSGYTAVSNNDRAILVSFRGTSGTWQLVMEGVDSIFKAKKPFVGGGKVDAYFYDAFYSLWNAGMRDDLLSLKAANPDYQLWVTGHSLGGAMASLCAALVIKLNMWSAADVKMVTLGQPRTGDMDFAEAHDTLLLYGYRVIHQNDIVPHLPPKIINNWFDTPYHHRYEIWYNNNMAPGSTYQVCYRSDADECSNTQSDTSINEHTHYFGVDVSDWGNQGCPHSALMTEKRHPKNLLNQIVKKAK